eukprot:7672212-Heterocapsa_arctica.AAC.1
MEAVNNNPSALQHASDELRGDQEFMPEILRYSFPSNNKNRERPARHLSPRPRVRSLRGGPA